jgi:hypothetical protein
MRLGKKRLAQGETFSKVEHRGMRKSRQLLAALAYIRAERAAGRRMPTGAQIAAYMGWKSPGSGCEVLMRLAAHGYLRVVDREISGRGWRYTYELAERESVRNA